jgi:hypothetical protein
MKKTLLMLFILFFAIPFVKSTSQTIAQSAGAYNELVQEYSVQFQGKEMSKEEEERLLKNLSAEMKGKLEEVKKLNKNKYYQLLRQSSVGSFAFSGSFYDSELKERFQTQKKQIELEVDTEVLALKCKNADSAGQANLKKELYSRLSELFEIREAQKQEEVKNLEKRLQELKESLQYRKQNKNEIVQRRIQEMLGDSKYLKWE